METPNEKKAREIAKCCSVMPPTPITQADVLAMTNNAAMQAMEWKDKERKELWRITRNHYQEWSEEDETIISNLIWAIQNDKMNPNDREEYCDWLKSLKERIK